MIPIEGYPGYEIDVQGNVYSPRTMLIPDERNGYRRVALKGVDGRRKWRPIHQLVLEAFHGRAPFEKAEGAHLDGNKHNNHYSNLEWKTRAQNEADKLKHGTSKRGKHTPPISKRQKRAMWQRWMGGVSFTQISKWYCVHRHTVSRIVKAYEP